MKIIIVGPAYPLRGAMAQLNGILGWHLSKRHDVQIISFTRQYPSLLFPGKSQRDPGKPLFDIPTLSMIDSINPLSWFRTASFIIQQQPDILIFRYWMPFFAPCFGSIIRFVKRKIQTRVIFICDNIVPHEKRPGDTALTKYAFHSVDAFIVLSKSVEKDLLHLFPEAHYRITPLPLFNVFGELQSKKDARMKLGIHEDRVLLFFGYVRAYKGLAILLDAMPLILQHMHAKLLIAGEFYENEEKYRSKIQKLGIENSVLLNSEYIPNEEIAAYFSAADVVVLPYVSATQSAIVPVAYHFSKPVIVTDVGGLTEVVTDGRTGFIVPPENPEAFAQAVIQYYSGNYESKFAANIQEEKKRFTWETFIEEIESLFEKRK
jgi:glycosyltransferase involved in cell wall biosynthesis